MSNIYIINLSTCNCSGWVITLLDVILGGFANLNIYVLAIWSIFDWGWHW